LTHPRSEPADREWEIGDDISFIVDEDVKWGRGYSLRGWVKGGSGDPLGGDAKGGISSYPAGRSLIAAFSASAEMDKMMGETVVLRLDDYYDVAGNPGDAYEFEFDIKVLDPIGVSSKVGGVLLQSVGSVCVGEEAESQTCDAFVRAQQCAKRQGMHLRQRLTRLLLSRAGPSLP
jgi:hypothetical protein